jgi:aryl-alcohol dehydrogenase-like predicted oxidoreductase
MYMPTHLLGQTRLRVSRLGLGLAALGRPGYINIGHAEDLGRVYDVAAMEAHAHAVLDAAWAAGVRYFDAARSYGRAEEFLSHWLVARAIAPESVTIGSKWGYTYTADWCTDAALHERKDHSLAVLRRQIIESRGWLSAHLDLYHIHSATLESGVLDDAAVMAELARYRAEGLAIGLTLSGPRQGEVLRRAMDVRVDGSRVFDVVQATWNLLERSAEAALAAAHASGMGVIVKEALANGRLTARNTDPEFAAKRRIIETVAARFQVGADALALAAACAQPWADVVLSGAARVDHLQSNIGALSVPWDDAADAALQALREPAEEYWQRRGRLPWN